MIDRGVRDLGVSLRRMRVQGNEGLEVEVFRSFTEMDHLKELWDMFIEKKGGDLYQSYDWCRVWWKFYGTGRKLLVFVFWVKDEIVGVVPLFVDQFGFGPTRIKVGKLVGSDFTTSIVGSIVDNQWGVKAYAWILREMLGKHGCHVLIYGPSPSVCSIAEAAALDNTIHIARQIDRGVYSKFLAPDGVDAFFDGLSKSEKRHLKQDQKQLERRFKVDVDVVEEEDDVINEFDTFVSVHQEQWKAQGKLGHFGDWPCSYEFTKEMLRVQAQNGRIRFFRLSCDGCIVLYKLCFAFGKRWHWRLPARRLGEKWDGLGLGRIGALRAIECAAREGISEVESGPGHYEYKVKMGATEEKLVTLVLARNDTVARIKARCFLALADLLHFLYYRVWFLKVAPKMPWRQGPLWRIWIRTHV